MLDHNLIHLFHGCLLRGVPFTNVPAAPRFHRMQASLNILSNTSNPFQGSVNSICLTYFYGVVKLIKVLEAKVIDYRLVSDLTPIFWGFDISPPVFPEN